LVVEILSPSTATRDRVDKVHLYRKAGIRRYLIVDIQTRTLEVLLLDGDSYRLEASLGPGDVWTLEDYPVTLTLDEIFDGIPSG
jgi:Uma2 family endonuclease